MIICLVLIVLLVLGTKSVPTVKTGCIISRTVNLIRRKLFNRKLLEQNIRQDSLQGKEMKTMKRHGEVAMKGPVLKPVLNVSCPV